MAGSVIQSIESLMMAVESTALQVVGSPICLMRVDTGAASAHHLRRLQAVLTRSRVRTLVMAGSVIQYIESLMVVVKSTALQVVS